MEYANKYYAINAYPELAAWATEVLEDNGALVLSKITTALEGVYYPRDNMIRRTESTMKRIYDIDLRRVEKGVKRLPLELLIEDLVNEKFRTTWVCNDPSVLKTRMTCEICMPDDDELYEYARDTLVGDCQKLGFTPKQQIEFGTRYVVIPKMLKASTIPWFKKVMHEAAAGNLYLIREDKFHEEANRISEDFSVTRTTLQRPVYSNKGINYWTSALRRSADLFPDEYVIIDTEHTMFGEERLITQVGLLHIKDGEVVDKFSSMVETKDNDPRVQPKFSRYSDEVIDDAVPIKDLKKIILRKMGNLPVVGYGIQMDLELLGKAFNERIDCEYVDVIWLAHDYLDLPNYKMETALEALHLPKQRHYAIDDCYSTLNLYQALMKKANLKA